MRLFVVAMLLLMPLAGCLDSPADPTSEAGLSAMEARSIAQKEADRWDPDARLAGVLYLEGSGAPHNATPATPVFADGRADAYAFFFAAPGQDPAWNVTVGGNGRILFSGPSDAQEDLKPIVDWRVDSTALFATLRADVEGFADRVGSAQDATLFGVLMTGQSDETFGFNGTLWIVLENTKEIYLHVVDATNGTLLGSFDFAEILGGLVAEGGSFTGTLTVLSPVRDHLFSLQDRHDAIRFRLTAENSVPLDSVYVNVTGPDGSHEAFVLALLPGDAAYFEMEPAPAGDWEARVDLQGAVVRYTLDYCTSGIPMGFGPGFGMRSEGPCYRVQQ